MTDIDALNEAAARVGGRWLTLRSTSDPAVDGEILSFETRAKTWEGKVVPNRTTGEPRTEWLFTLATALREDDEDDGRRKLVANESMQRAIAVAIKEAKTGAEIGGRLRVAVTEDAPSATDQATYRAKYDPPKLAVPVDDLFSDGV